MHPSEAEVQPLIDAALAEDIGRGDLTSALLIPLHLNARLAFVAREPLVACGTRVAAQVFATLDASVRCDIRLADGDHVEGGEPIMTVEGPARALLAAERTALNLMQRLSSVATFTAVFMEHLKGTDAVLLDTRKTTPGLRVLEKYAVRAGGGRNHRLRLDDGVLIKDNHIALAGGVAQAVALARKGAPALTRIEVECDTLTQVQEAVEARPDVILLDNMPVGDLRKAVRFVDGRVQLEASGGVTLENVRAIADTGVDFISVGAITHSAPHVDIGLDVALD